MSHANRAANEYAAAIDAADESVYRVLEQWAESHTNNGSHLELLPAELDQYPFQRLDVVSLEPEPDLDIARQLGKIGAGVTGYNKLIQDFQRAGMLQAIRADAKNGVSTLIATPHLKSVLDTAITHNAFFVASEDETMAETNILVANHLMKFLKVGGVAVPQVLAKSGKVIFGWPKSASRRGVPVSIAQAGNKVFAYEFSELTGRGVIVHRALTDTRAVDGTGPDGSAAKILPLVENSVVQIARKRTPKAVGVAMVTEDSHAVARILRPRELAVNKDVHALVGQIALATGELAGEPVFYEGLLNSQRAAV